VRVGDDDTSPDTQSEPRGVKALEPCRGQLVGGRDGRADGDCGLRVVTGQLVGNHVRPGTTIVLPHAVRQFRDERHDLVVRERKHGDVASDVESSDELVGVPCPGQQCDNESTSDCRTLEQCLVRWGGDLS
jgi:hypothetical protein